MFPGSYRLLRYHTTFCVPCNFHFGVFSQATFTFSYVPERLSLCLAFLSHFHFRLCFQAALANKRLKEALAQQKLAADERRDRLAKKDMSGIGARVRVRITDTPLLKMSA